MKQEIPNNLTNAARLLLGLMMATICVSGSTSFGSDEISLRRARLSWKVEKSLEEQQQLRLKFFNDQEELPSSVDIDAAFSKIKKNAENWSSLTPTQKVQTAEMVPEVIAQLFSNPTEDDVQATREEGSLEWQIHRDRVAQVRVGIMSAVAILFAGVVGDSPEVVQFAYVLLGVTTVLNVFSCHMKGTPFTGRVDVKVLDRLNKAVGIEKDAVTGVKEGGIKVLERLERVMEDGAVRVLERLEKAAGIENGVINARVF